jgi:hypothetical protein
MSTKYIASNWRLPNEENSNKSDNYGLSFDGTEFIDCGSNLFNNSTISSISISCWIKTTSGSSNAIISKDLATAGNKNFMLQLSGNDLYWQTSTDGASFQNLQLTNAEFDLLDGNWHNIIATYNAGSTSADGEKLIYVDGVLRKTDPAATLNNIYNTTSVDINIGRKGDATRFFNGSISELSIFNYALSSTQVSTLYGSSSLGAGNPMALKPQPVAYYPLGDNSASNPLTQPNEAVEDASVFDFDGGANTYIDLGTNEILFDSTQPFSCSVWCKVDSYSSPQYPALFSFKTDQSTGFIMFLSHTGSYKGINFGSDNNFLRRLAGNQSDIPLNTWFHIVLTYDGVDRTSASSYKVYLNTSEKTQVNSGAFAACPNENNIGGGNATNTRFNGQISNAQIWNTKLSDSEIETLYNSGVPLLTGTQPQASNLRAWYKLDQSANWEADTSGNWQIPDAVSAYPQSFDFDNTANSHIKLGSSLGNFLGDSYSGDLTLSMWFNADTSIINKGLFQIGTTTSQGVFSVRGVSGTAISFGLNQIGYTSKFNFSDLNNWHHLVCIYKGGAGGSTKMYLDGVQQSTTDSGTFPTSLDFDTEEAYIGLIYNLTGYDWDGKISNVQFWNTEIPATGTNSVQTLYNNGTPLTTAIASDNLKLWAKLDNTATFSTNWSIPDDSGNGNTGTSSGMTEQNLVNNNVSVLNGESSGMTSASLVLSDLSRSLPYDSYSFSFDNASNDYISTAFNIPSGNKAVSFWFNSSYAGYQCILGNANDAFILGSFSSQIPLPNGISYMQGSTNKTFGVTASVTDEFADGQWHHFVYIYDGNSKIYIDGTERTISYKSGTLSTDDIVTITNLGLGLNRAAYPKYTGKLSNCAIFNEALTSTEVLKLYANGVPQDLTNFTPAPISWWTLGSNSFFNGTNYICRDLIGSNDGTSANAGVDALVGDAPRSSANRTGSNMDIPTNLEGSTKWSSNNSWSINMSSTARVEDTP